MDINTQNKKLAGDIILYDKDTHWSQSSTSLLKEFLSFIKFAQIKGPINFNYVESHGP